MMSDVTFYLRLLIRRSPAMAALFILCSVMGVVVAFRLPAMYGTSATLLVESAQIAEDGRGSGDVAQSEQLEVVQRRLMTRANLLDIARANNVFPDIRSMTPDEIVEGMRRQTRINRRSGRRQATLMEIGFEAQRPETAAAVVNQYVNLVLETNSDLRSQLTQGNLEFFRREVQTHSENLEQLGQRIAQFKVDNSDSLPEMLSYNLNRQSSLQEGLLEAERDLEALRQQRADIERIYEETGSIQAAGDAVKLTPDQVQLQKLESDLRAALSVYSELNPRVRLLKNRIDTLRADIEAAAVDRSVPAAEESEGETSKPTALAINLAELDTQIETLARKIEEDRARLETVTGNIDRTAANRITLESLERDFQNAQGLYNQAIQNLNQTERQLRIELSARGERISVVEPASVPNAPSSPNRAAVAGMGVAAGLGLAAGFFLLLELLNQSIRRPQDIQKKLSITPLAVLPRLETPRRRTARRLLQVATVLVVLVTVPAALWAVDTYYMPLDLLFERVRDRLL